MEDREMPPTPEPLIRLPLHFAAQWNMAVLCAEREPHKLVTLEGRCILALEDAIRAASLTKEKQE